MTSSCVVGAIDVVAGGVDGDVVVVRTSVNGVSAERLAFCGELDILAIFDCKQ